MPTASAEGSATEVRGSGQTLSYTARRPPAPTSRGPLFGIQYLRAIAALMVVCYHSLDQLDAYKVILRDSPLGWLNLPSGVDVFFVISGFIMVAATRRTTPSQFLLRRLIRVVPLYWILTLVLVTLGLAHPGWLRSTVLGPSEVLESLLFIPYANPGHEGQLVPLLVPGWSLNFEMAFYAVFALLLFLPQQRRSAVSGVFFAAVLALPLVLPDGLLPRPLLFYASPRLFEFWFGMLIAESAQRGRQTLMAPLTAAGLIVVGAGMLLGPSLWSIPEGLGQLLRIFKEVLPAAAIVLGVVALEQAGRVRRIGWLNWLGDASYSMYLSHIFALGLARALWLRLGMGVPDGLHAVAFLVFGLVSAVVLTWICHRWLEVPVTRILQGWSERPRPA